MTMLPPTPVDSWASQSKRNGRLARTAMPPDSTSGSSIARALPVPGRRAVLGEMPSLIACRRRHGLANCQVAAHSEVDQPSLQGPPLEQDVPAARAAAQANIRAQPVDEPLLAAAWMDATQPHDIAEAKRDDRRLISRHYWSPHRVGATESYMAVCLLYTSPSPRD